MAKAMLAAATDRLLFPPPPSPLLTALSLVSLASMYAGVSEAKGKHLQYSKFWNAGPVGGRGSSTRIPTRVGMLVAYTPAFLVAAASFWGFPADVAGTGTRGLLLRSALTVHFLKRVLEVLFVHQYSGHMILGSAIPISASYSITTMSLIYAQHLTAGMPEPSTDLKYAGVIFFLGGILGNFYHHRILSKLRGENERAYKIPKGGLFGLVICPHYLFEIIGFVGLAFISQTFYAVASTMAIISYLAGRSYATRKWYLSKFEKFPVEVRALVPYVF